jgi:hypothetical protein
MLSMLSISCPEDASALLAATCNLLRSLCTSPERTAKMCAVAAMAVVGAINAYPADAALGVAACELMVRRGRDFQDFLFWSFKIFCLRFFSRFFCFGNILTFFPWGVAYLSCPFKTFHCLLIIFLPLHGQFSPKFSSRSLSFICI